MKPYSPITKLCLILLLVLFQRQELYGNAHPEPLSPSFQSATGGAQVQVLYMSPEEGEAFRRTMEEQGATTIEVTDPAELDRLLAQAEATPSPLPVPSNPNAANAQNPTQETGPNNTPAGSFQQEQGQTMYNEDGSQVSGQLGRAVREGVGRGIGDSVGRGLGGGGGKGGGDGMAGLLVILGLVIVIVLIFYAVRYLYRQSQEDQLALKEGSRPADAKPEATLPSNRPEIEGDVPIKEMEPTGTKKKSGIFSSRYWLGRDSAYRFWFGRGASKRRWTSLGLGVYGFQNSKEWGGLSSVHFAMGTQRESFEWGMGAELGWINSSLALAKDRPNLQITGAYIAAGPLLIYNQSQQSQFYLELLGGTSEHKEVHTVAKAMVGYRWQSDRGYYLAASTGSLMVSLKSSLGYVRDQNPFNWLSGVEAGWTF